MKNTEATKQKSTFKKVVRVTLYIILALVFLASWNIRQEFIVGPVPVIIHLAIFYFLFWLIRKIK